MAYQKEDCSRAGRVAGTRFEKVRERLDQLICQFNNETSASFYDQVPCVLPFGRDGGIRHPSPADGSNRNYGVLSQDQFNGTQWIRSKFESILLRQANDNLLTGDDQAPLDEIDPFLWDNSDWDNPVLTTTRTSDQAIEDLLDARTNGIPGNPVPANQVSLFIDDLGDWADWRWPALGIRARFTAAAQARVANQPQDV